MKSRLTLFFSLLVLWGCNNIEDASPSGKSSFIKFFHGPYNYTGVEVEVLPDGYAILGNMTLSEDSTVSFVIRTDEGGVPVNDISYFPGQAKSFEVFYSGGQVSGYMILSDSIKIDPAASRVGNIEVYSTLLLKVNTDGTIVKQLTYTDPTTDTSRVKIDYKANSIKINELGQVIVLGNFREDLSRPEKSYVAALDTDLNLLWRNEYELLDAGQVDYNYVNGRSVHYSNGNIVWASAILKPSQGFNDSYLAIPYIAEGSTFQNFSELGETSSQLFLANDIQPSRGATFGYGVVGTRGLTDGSRTNMFFARVNAQGSFIANSERYFDAALSQTGGSVAFSDSESEDQGEALTSTFDGGYALAGSTRQGTTLRDIYLVKVNPFGDLVWNRTLGGSGDETVCTIREKDNGLVICGTNTLSGLSSIFLIKTDSNGELKN